MLSPVPTPPRSFDSGASQNALWQRLQEAELAAVRADAESGARADEEYVGAWLALQCGLIPGAVRGAVVLGDPDTGPFTPVAVWPPDTVPSAILAEAADQTLQTRNPFIVPPGDHGPTAALACPVKVDAHLHGLVAVETAATADATLADALRSLQWGTQGLVASIQRSQARSDAAARERLVATLDVMAATLGEERYAPAAHALATDLALRLDCDRVSIGFRRREHCEVVALSHSAMFGKRMDLVRTIGAAMDEAIDQRSTIVLPARREEVLVVRDHAALARRFGSDSIMTVPFVAGEGTRGAFTFERPGARPFDAQTVELAQAAVALCSRILEGKRLNDRSFIARAGDAMREELERFLGPRHVARKLVVIAAVGITAFLAVAEADYRVTGNASLEGTVRRVLIAPYDGYVESARHRAGDVVKEGAVIAALDQRDLRLEYLRWSAQREQYGKQYQEALARRDRAQTDISLSQAQQAQAQMDLISAQLHRASVAAPFDGIIVSGDLHQALGSAVKRGQTLFEVAPLNAYRVVVQVDEAEIEAVKEGQAGALVLAALPGETLPLSVASVTPVTNSRDGRTYFRVDATLERTSERLRPGMEGVAKIEAGRRPLIWIWTHRLVDWLRLAVWSWQ